MPVYDSVPTTRLFPSKNFPLKSFRYLSYTLSCQDLERQTAGFPISPGCVSKPQQITVHPNYTLRMIRGLPWSRDVTRDYGLGPIGIGLPTTGMVPSVVIPLAFRLTHSECDRWRWFEQSSATPRAAWDGACCATLLLNNPSPGPHPRATPHP